jgi:hypothetical protein
MDDVTLIERLQKAAARAGKGYFDPRTIAADILLAATRIAALTRIKDQSHGG